MEKLMNCHSLERCDPMRHEEGNGEKQGQVGGRLEPACSSVAQIADAPPPGECSLRPNKRPHLKAAQEKVRDANRLPALSHSPSPAGQESVHASLIHLERCGVLSRHLGGS